MACAHNVRHVWCSLQADELSPTVCPFEHFPDACSGNYVGQFCRSYYLKRSKQQVLCGDYEGKKFWRLKITNCCQALTISQSVFISKR